MGRPTRIQFSGACYYITLLGNNRQDLFLSNQDRRFFLSLLKSYKERYDLTVYAYCLMDQEIQLLIETGQGNLSRVMQGFNTSYTKYFNRVHRTTGHVFQGRFKALLVDKDDYLLEMTSRVHLTPVRAGLKEKPWRYLWSSCAAYVESENRDPLVDSATVLSRFAKNRLKQSVKYLHYIKERMKSAEKAFFPVHGICVGKQEFAESVQSVSGSNGQSIARERARQIIAEIAARGIDEERLLGRGRWQDVAAVRKEAIYRLWREANLGVTEISRMFHRTPSAVSQMIHSMELARSVSVFQK